MPERGWSILTVRECTAKKVKELARKRELTVDEFLNELMNPSSKEGWSTCRLCGVKVKSKNLHEHMVNVHPESATDAKNPLD